MNKMPVFIAKYGDILCHQLQLGDLKIAQGTKSKWTNAIFFLKDKWMPRNVVTLLQLCVFLGKTNFRISDSTLKLCFIEYGMPCNELWINEAQLIKSPLNHYSTHPSTTACMNQIGYHKHETHVAQSSIQKSLTPIQFVEIKTRYGTCHMCLHQ